jgi:hypothetical protein
LAFSGAWKNSFFLLSWFYGNNPLRNTEPPISRNTSRSKTQARIPSEDSWEEDASNLGGILDTSSPRLLVAFLYICAVPERASASFNSFRQPFDLPQFKMSNGKSDADAEQDRQVEMWKVKKLIKSLQAARG